MNKPNMEQLAAAQKANAEVMMALLRTAFNGVERLTALNMAASREFFNNTVSNAQQLLGAKDAGEVAKLNSELAKPNVDKWVDYSRTVYDLVSSMQKEVTAVMESQYSSFAKNASSAVEKATASARMSLIFAFWEEVIMPDCVTVCGRTPGVCVRARSAMDQTNAGGSPPAAPLDHPSTCRAAPPKPHS